MAPIEPSSEDSTMVKPGRAEAWSLRPIGIPPSLHCGGCGFPQGQVPQELKVSITSFRETPLALILRLIQKEITGRIGVAV